MKISPLGDNLLTWHGNKVKVHENSVKQELSCEEQHTCVVEPLIKQSDIVPGRHLTNHVLLILFQIFGFPVTLSHVPEDETMKNWSRNNTHCTRKELMVA